MISLLFQILVKPPFDYHSRPVSNTWNYAVTYPLSNGESRSSLPCSYQKLFAIKG